MDLHHIPSSGQPGLPADHNKHALPDSDSSPGGSFISRLPRSLWHGHILPCLDTKSVASLAVSCQAGLWIRPDVTTAASFTRADSGSEVVRFAAFAATLPHLVTLRLNGICPEDLHAWLLPADIPGRPTRSPLPTVRRLHLALAPSAPAANLSEKLGAGLARQLPFLERLTLVLPRHAYSPGGRYWRGLGALVGGPHATLQRLSVKQPRPNHAASQYAAAVEAAAGVAALQGLRSLSWHLDWSWPWGRTATPAGLTRLKLAGACAVEVSERISPAVANNLSQLRELRAQGLDLTPELWVHVLRQLPQLRVLACRTVLRFPVAPAPALEELQELRCLQPCSDVESALHALRALPALACLELCARPELRPGHITQQALLLRDLSAHAEARGYSVSLRLQSHRDVVGSWWLEGLLTAAGQMAGVDGLEVQGLRLSGAMLLAAAGSLPRLTRVCFDECDCSGVNCGVLSNVLGHATDLNCVTLRWCHGLSAGGVMALARHFEALQRSMCLKVQHCAGVAALVVDQLQAATLRHVLVSVEHMGSGAAPPERS